MSTESTTAKNHNPSSYRKLVDNIYLLEEAFQEQLREQETIQKLSLLSIISQNRLLEGLSLVEELDEQMSSKSFKEFQATLKDLLLRGEKLEISLKEKHFPSKNVDFVRYVGNVSPEIQKLISKVEQGLVRENMVNEFVEVHVKTRFESQEKAIRDATVNLMGEGVIFVESGVYASHSKKILSEFIDRVTKAFENEVSILPFSSEHAAVGYLFTEGKLGATISNYEKFRSTDLMSNPKYTEQENVIKKIKRLGLGI